MGTPDCKYMGNIFVDLIRTNVWANSPIRTSSYTFLWKYSPMKETQRAPVHTANLLLLQQLLLLLLLLLLLIMIMMIIKTANFHYAKASMKWLFVSVSMLCGRGSEVRDKIESIKHRQLFRKKTLLKKNIITLHGYYTIIIRLPLKIKYHRYNRIVFEINIMN